MPPGLYVLVFPLAFFPFGLWPLLAIPDSWANRREPGVRFCLGWIVPVWILFELSLTKLPHYVLPLYPAIALLAAKALGEGFPALAGRGWRWLPPVAVSAWLLAGTFYAVALVLVPHFFGQGWNAGSIAAATLLLIAQGAGLFLLLRRGEGSVLVMAAGGLIFFMSLFGSTLPRLPPLETSQNIVVTAASIKPCPGPLQLSSAYVEPSLVFLAGTGTRLRPNSYNVARDLAVDPCRVGVVDLADAGPFTQAVEKMPAKPRLVTRLRGFDLARGGWHSVAFYLMPRKAGTP